MLDKRGRAIRSTTAAAPSPTTPNNRSGMNHNPMTTSLHQQQQQQQHIFSSTTNGGNSAIKRSTSRGSFMNVYFINTITVYKYRIHKYNEKMKLGQHAYLNAF
jgi:hypothetical protein